jgi:hypothetical protein
MSFSKLIKYSMDMCLNSQVTTVVTNILRLEIMLN